MAPFSIPRGCLHSTKYKEIGHKLCNASNQKLLLNDKTSSKTTDQSIDCTPLLNMTWSRAVCFKTGHVGFLSLSTADWLTVSLFFN